MNTSTEENSTETTLEKIISAISKDSAFYISLTVFLGYILITIQKLARYIYYRVELVYLLDLTPNDVFLSLLYALIIVIFSFTINELFNKAEDETHVVPALKHIVYASSSFIIELFLLLLCFILIFYAFVGLSMMCYKKEKEFKTCFGERQDKGRMGKSLY